MRLPKAAKPATDVAVNGPHAVDLAGELERRDATLNKFKFQVGQLVTRFGLTEQHAAVIAALAYGEVPR